MAKVSVGDICFVGRSNRLALVVFSREPHESRPEDVRVVPLALAGAASATERDALIPADATELRVALVAEAWNARSIVSAILSPALARVDSRITEAVRRAEMVGIDPAIDVTSDGDLMGRAPDSPQAIERAAGFQRRELETWNAIEERSFADTEAPETRFEFTYAKMEYRNRAREMGPVMRRVSVETFAVVMRVGTDAWDDESPRVDEERQSHEDAGSAIGAAA